MRVAVTGAGGFVGGPLVRCLLEHGCEVAALVRSAPALETFADVRHRLTCITGDLRSDDVGRALETFRPDACIHGAWYTVPGRYQHGLENLDSVGATATLLRSLTRTTCRRFVMIGTCAQYQRVEDSLTETSADNPGTLYAASKQAAWMMTEGVAAECGWTAANARLFQVYGPREPEARMVPSVIRSLLASKRCPLTTGSQIRDFLHVEDVADALAMVVRRNDISGVVNVAGGRPVAVADVARSIGEQLHRAQLLGFGERPASADDPPSLWARPGRLHDIGWRPRLELPDGLRHTIEWWKERVTNGC
jgi:nucleoside-diphosphate-sugar epimerase